MPVRPVRCSVLALGTVIVTMSPVSSAAHPAVPTCFGKPATIVDTSEDSSVRGTAGPDVMVVLGRTDAHGLGGDDLICGGGSIWGGTGDDRISKRDDRNGFLSFRVVFGGPGNDEIHRDEVLTDDPHFLLLSFGGPGDDLLFGGPNTDLLAGGPGTDRADGRASGDVVLGGEGPDQLSGGFRNDTLKGGPGADRMRGEAGEDSFRGGDGSDLIHGGDGDDFARGERGNDRILGQAGIDTVDGGPGADVCWGEEVTSCQR
jgi:Ca2+-binding RTX toxin-like protein